MPACLGHFYTENEGCESWVTWFQTNHKRVVEIWSSSNGGHEAYCLLRNDAMQSGIQVQLMWNLMVHAQKSHFVFCLNGRVHLNRQGCQFSQLLAAHISISNAGYTTYWGHVRVLATHSICQFPLHFHSRASPCATTFRTQYTIFFQNTGTCLPNYASIVSHPTRWTHILTAMITSDFIQTN